MTDEDIKQFFSTPVLMDIATITPEGYPHVTPVWFEYDGIVFRVSTTRERKKARNLMKNQKVGFSIAGHTLPYEAVVGYGDAIMQDDPEGKLLQKLARKYLPAEKADTYYKKLMESPEHRVIVTIKPRWMSSWKG